MFAHRIPVDRLLRLMCVAMVGALIPSQTALCAQERDEQLSQAPSTREESRFAPGVLTVIPPAPEPEETFDAPQTLQALLNAESLDVAGQAVVAATFAAEQGYQACNTLGELVGEDDSGQFVATVLEIMMDL